MDGIINNGNPPVAPDEGETKVDINTNKNDYTFGSEVVSDIDDNNNNNNDTTKNNDTNDDNKSDKIKEEKKNNVAQNDDDNKSNDNDDGLIKSFVPGAKIEIGKSIYNVDVEGNLVDDKGNIFKKKDELADYVKTLEQSDEDGKNDLTIDKIIETVGVEILNEDNTPVTYEDTPEGIQQYINAVIETSRQEIAETTINTLWDKYPEIKSILDYYIANGNSLEGFNGKPDRSNLVVDENNQSQQEEIIRMAWKERGQEIDDSYIAYLKSSGTLLTVAEKELENIKQADEKERKRIADEAAIRERETLEANQKYWEGVKEVITNRKIAGYEIPDTILIKKDGKQIAATPTDFFNYLYQIDKEGYSRYQRDLMAEDANARRDDEILRAFLKFTGGTYANLVDMAVKQKEVLKLRNKANEANARKTTIKVTPPANQQTGFVFGV